MDYVIIECSIKLKKKVLGSRQPPCPLLGRFSLNTQSLLLNASQNDFQITVIIIGLKRGVTSTFSGVSWYS